MMRLATWLECLDEVHAPAKARAVANDRWLVVTHVAFVIRLG